MKEKFANRQLLKSFAKKIFFYFFLNFCNDLIWAGVAQLQTVFSFDPLTATLVCCMKVKSKIMYCCSEKLKRLKYPRDCNVVAAGANVQ